MDRDLDEVRLAEVLLLDRNPRGKRPLQVVEDAVGLPGESEGIRTRLLLDAQDHGRHAAVGRGAASGLGRQRDRGDLAQPQGNPLVHTQNGVGQVLGGARAAQPRAPEEVHADTASRDQAGT